MKRPADKNPEPPGGRAAERLRMFENARLDVRETKASNPAKKSRSRQHEKQTRRKR